MIEKALRVAMDVHQGVLDKGGVPFILHPIRVMIQLADEEAQVVALLHDILEEDENLSPSDLVMIGFPPHIVGHVVKLTRLKEGQSYKEYIKLVSESHSVVRRVKIADLRDNLNNSRPYKIPKGLKDRYWKALKFLTGIPG